jgi:hypothetical protein
MKAAKRVNFQDIVKLETLTDEEHIVLVYLNSRVMRLSLKDSLPFLLAVQQNMKVSFLFFFFLLFFKVFYSVCGCSHTQPPPLDYPSAKFKAEDCLNTHIEGVGYMRTGDQKVIGTKVIVGKLIL